MRKPCLLVMIYACSHVSESILREVLRTDDNPLRRSELDRRFVPRLSRHNNVTSLVIPESRPAWLAVDQPLRDPLFKYEWRGA